MRAGLIQGRLLFIVSADQSRASVRGKVAIL